MPIFSNIHKHIVLNTRPIITFNAVWNPRVKNQLNSNNKIVIILFFFLVLTGSTSNLISHWKTSDDNNQLRIEGTLLTDTSTIHCNVSNRHGSLLAGAYLQVYGKCPFFLQNIFLISIEMDSELLQDLFLICKVVDHLPNFNKQCLGYSSSTFQENEQHLMNTPYIFIIDLMLF